MSIIAISGRIGSGKDTVGRIIQYLTSEYRDKYNFVEWIDRVENYGSNTYSPFEIKKFAGKLKTIASLLTGVPVEMFEDQEFKKQFMPDEWNYFNTTYLEDVGRIDHHHQMTYREFLQKLGTEAMRNVLHTDVWVNALFSDVSSEDNIIITDMRFLNEYEAVKKRKGITIRVVRPIHALSQENNCGLLHSSETSLDDVEFDYTIVNDSTIEDLIEKVKEILIKENII